MTLSLEKIAELKEFAEELNLILSLENTFEPDSEFFKEVLKNVEGVFWCFDPAHARVFSKENEIKGIYRIYKSRPYNSNRLFFSKR